MSQVTENIDIPRQVVPAKDFFFKERDNLYADWTLGIWRELFQNSVDKGAEKIDITVAEASPKGSFGREVRQAPVTRIVFDDDGGGMSESILDNVYFRLGATTKNDETTVGGFGRARIMTCFGQERYAIHTQDRFVEGDGGEYLNLSKQEALAALARWTEANRQRARVDVPAHSQWHTMAAHGLEAEIARLQSAPDHYAGCRIEIDIDPTGRDRRYNHTNTDGMLAQLQAYLEQSDVKCQVTVNGVPYVRPNYKSQRRKTLFVTVPANEFDEKWRNSKVKIVERPDGKIDVGFANVHVLTDGNIPASVKNELIVRVSGAAMFTQSISDKPGIFVEINPFLARTVLTSNRDGLKEPFAGALEDFKRTLATDSQQALKEDDDTEFTVLKGGRGAKVGRIKPAETDVASQTEDAARDAGQAGTTLSDRVYSQRHHVNYDDSSYRWQKFLDGEIDEIDPKAFLKFFELIESSGFESTFLKDFHNRAAAESFALTLKSSGPHRAMVEASGVLLGFLADNLNLRKIAAEQAARAAYQDRMAQFNDIPILKENLSPTEGKLDPKEARGRRSRLVAAARHHDPRSWDVATGKGLRPRKVLTAWQVAVDNVVEMLFTAYPATKEFSYSSGWLFTHPQWRWNTLQQDESWNETHAMLSKKKEGDQTNVHFLLNPLDSNNDFKIKYNPSDADDRDQLITLAMHEAAHIVSRHGHDDAFAEAFTTLSKLMTSRERRRIHKEIVDTVKVVDQIYASGKTRIVPLDNEPGLRPAERLLTNLLQSPSTIVSDAADQETTVDMEAIYREEDELVGHDPETERVLSPGI